MENNKNLLEVVEDYFKNSSKKQIEKDLKAANFDLYTQIGDRITFGDNKRKIKKLNAKLR